MIAFSKIIGSIVYTAEQIWLTDLNVDASGPDFRVFGQFHEQHAVLKLCFNGVDIDIHGQFKGSLELAVWPLLAMPYALVDDGRFAFSTKHQLPTGDEQFHIANF
jgi:hypothetical protein